jgi:hypothetical protein
VPVQISYPLSYELSDLFVEISKSGRMTLVELYLLKVALVENSLNEEERFSINRILYALGRKWIEIVL